MSGKFVRQTSKNYEDQLNQLILLFKSQQLCAKKKSSVDERNKRLNNNYNIVDGRKLDQDKYKLSSKLFGHNPNNKNPKTASGNENASVKEKPENLQEQFKNFAFNFPKENQTVSLNLSKLLKITETKAAIDKRSKANIESIKSVIDKTEEVKVSSYQLDRLYFVLDTNVLIDNLQLLEEVANLMLFDTAGSVLYIPYIVIKELDMLKSKPATKYAARQAINYLNDKFDELDNIEAQSPLDDARQLIDIDSSDDNIINCCLQLKQLQHMMLLTNDNNLRLKAYASAIQVSTCYQLIGRRGSWWSPNRDRRRHRNRAWN